MSLDTPPSAVDPDAVAGATSLRARCHTQLETGNQSIDEQLDGESFRFSRRPFVSSIPSTRSSLTRVHPDHLDSDAEVDTVVRKASSHHHEVASESVSACDPQSLQRNDPTPIQTLVHGQTRGRSKTISSIPQNPSSFAKLAQDKLLRMESDSSLTVAAPFPTHGSYYCIADLTPSPSTTTSRQPLHHPSTSRPPSSSASEEPAKMQTLDPAVRVQSAPVRPEPLIEQDFRPHAGRSQSDTAVRSSPAKAGSDKPSDVRKRIEELEAKMRGGVQSK